MKLNYSKALIKLRSIKRSIEIIKVLDNKSFEDTSLNKILKSINEIEKEIENLKKRGG